MCISANRITELLTTEHFGRNILLLDSVDSTNSYLKNLTEATHGTVVISESQTGGRGRRGRSFWSPRGGIYMSLLSKIDGDFDAGKITSCVALSVCKAIESVAELKPQIKWVNDIFIGSKKVCGILCEALTNPTTSSVEGVVIGIGVNVNDAEIPQELESIVTNLNRESGKALSRNILVSEILNNLEKDLNTVDDRNFLEELRRRSALLGKRITVHSPQGDYKAEAVDLDESCRLIVKRGEETLALSSGEVSITGL